VIDVVGAPGEGRPSTAFAHFSSHEQARMSHQESVPSVENAKSGPGGGKGRRQGVADDIDFSRPRPGQTPIGEYRVPQNMSWQGHCAEPWSVLMARMVRALEARLKG
jgi:hypothetical protein